MTFDLLFLFIFSLIFNFIMLVAFKLGLFGKNIRKTTKRFLIKQPISIYFSYFGFILLLFFYISFQTIYCEDYTITTVIQNVEVSLTGEVLNNLLKSLGSAVAFQAGVYIAASILSKYKIYAIPKIGAIVGTGAWFTIIYNAVIHINFCAFANSLAKSIILSLGQPNSIDPNTSSAGLNSILTILTKFFGGLKIETKIPEVLQQTSDVIQALNNNDLNWRFRDLFINSPIESGDNSLLNYILETLPNSFNLHFINIYLLTMIIIIFTCKIILDNNINLEFLKNYIFGKYLYWGINKYLNIWRGSTNLWIYYLLFCVLIFHSGSAYAVYQVLEAVKSVQS